MNKDIELLKVLNIFLNALPGNTQVFVFGGFSVDGHHGKLTRNHSDVDLICWRKDVDDVCSTLEDIGYLTEVFPHPQDSKLIYKINSTDDDKTFGIQIIDEAPDSQFQISFWHFLKQLYQVDLLGPVNVSLDGTKFPSVSVEFTRLLKEQECAFYEKLRTQDPTRYAKREAKHMNCLDDLKVLSE
ncbi:MAG TPA: hypothetical protein QF873_00165 [Patescibacteria group bacterium]|nr:hypothetical protein [Patescibacteria group bacterium]